MNAKEVELVINQLVELGLLTKKDDWFIADNPQIDTGDRVASAALKQYHHANLQMAQSALEELSALEREISAVTLALTEENALALKKRLQEFRKELFSFETPESDREIYQINFQLFPLTQSQGKS